MSFIEDVSQLDMLSQLGCRNGLITELFDVPYINVSVHDIEEGMLETCQTAMSLFALKGRVALVSLFCRLGKGKLLALFFSKLQKHFTHVLTLIMTKLLPKCL